MVLYFSFQPYTIQSVFPLTSSSQLADYKNTLNFSITVLGPMDCSQWRNPRITVSVTDSSLELASCCTVCCTVWYTVLHIELFLLKCSL